MFDLTNTKSLTDFNRNCRDHIDWLRQTGKPELLTINGEAAVVVQDAAAYQDLLGQADYARSVQAIRAGMTSHARGEGIDFLAALEGLAEKNGIAIQAKKANS